MITPQSTTLGFIGAGFDIPITEALQRYCETGPYDWRDNMNRPYTSFWHQLMQNANNSDE